MENLVSIAELLKKGNEAKNVFEKLLKQEGVGAYVRFDSGNNRRINRGALCRIPRKALLQLELINKEDGDSFEYKLEILHGLEIFELEGHDYFITGNEQQTNENVVRSTTTDTQACLLNKQLPTNRPSTDDVFEHISVPQWNLAKPVTPMTVEEAIEQGIPEESAVAHVKFVNHGIRYLDNEWVTTQKTVSLSNIFVKHSEFFENTNDKLPLHFDPLNPECTERCQVFFHLAGELATRKEMPSSMITFVVEKMRKLGFDVSKDCEAAKRYAWLLGKESSKTHAIKKIDLPDRGTI